MKFSLISSAIIGASMVLAAPAPQQEVRVVTEVEQYTTVVPVTTVIGQQVPTGTAVPAGENISVDVLNMAPLDGNFNSTEIGRDTNDADGSIVSYSTGASNSISGSANPNQIGGSPGNAGSILGSGTNDFGTDVYDYSGFPGGFQQQPGQSANGSYGPDSGPGDDAVTVSSNSGSESAQSPQSFTSTFFRLVAHVTGNDDPYGINGYYLSTYHVSSGSSIAHLTSPSGGTDSGNSRSSRGTGRVFHTNGTSFEAGHHLGTTVTSGGDSPFPESIVLTDGLTTTNVAASNIGNIYINQGEGTKGVQVEQNDQGIYVLSGAGDAGYYACYNENVPYAATHTLKYLMDGEEVPSECTPIVLVPQCASGDGNPYTTGEANEDQQNQIGCYISVNDIDWSQYR